MNETKPPAPEPAWCVVANVVLERGYGPGGVEIRRGTKLFAPGAKVHVLRLFWHSDRKLDQLTVVGRHRKSHRFITTTMANRHLANWRVELIYSPYVVEQLRQHKIPWGEDASWQGDLGSEEARLEAEKIAQVQIELDGKNQSFTTRPPTIPPPDPAASKPDDQSATAESDQMQIPGRSTDDLPTIDK